MTNVADLDERRVEAFLSPLREIEPARRRTRPSKKVGLRVAVAIGVAAAVAGLIALPGDRVTTAPAAAVLEDVAQVAARRPVPIASDGYTYSKSLAKSRIVFRTQQPWSVVVFQTDEVWLADDGSGRASTRYGNVTFPSSRARAEWANAGEALVPADRRFTLRAKFRDVDRLPRDPDRLLDVIRAEAERASSGRRGVAPYESFEHLMWVRLRSILAVMHSETDRRPRLRAAIYRALGRIDGATLLGRMLDPMGRAGVGVAFTVDGIRDVVVFDPRTSRLLADKTVLVEPSGYPEYADVRAGGAVTWRAYLRSARVRSLGEVPG